MQLSVSYPTEISYHEEYEINFSAFHDDFTQCLNWSAIAQWGSFEQVYLPTAILNRYFTIYGTPKGSKVIRIAAKCECATADGEAEDSDIIKVIRTRLGISSTPSHAQIYFCYAGTPPVVDQKLVTPEILELGIPASSAATVEVRLDGYDDSSGSIAIDKDGKTEKHLKLHITP